MCVHRSPPEISSSDITVSLKLKRTPKTMRRFLKALAKEGGNIALTWIALSCAFQLAKCAPLSGGGGIFARPLKSENGGTLTSSSGFVSGFASSISMIVATELGDKTFFIAAIMAMKHSRLVVFMGAISALAFMTVFSGIYYILF